MEEKITGFVEERKGMFLREKMALEIIDYLEEVVKKMKSDKTEKSTSTSGGSQNEVSRGYTIWKKCVDKKTCRTIGSTATHLTNVEMNGSSAFPPSSYPSPVQGNLEDVHVSVNKLPMGYPELQQPSMPATAHQPHLDSMGHGNSSCHVVNRVPAHSNFYPMQMNSGSEICAPNILVEEVRFYQ